MRTKPPPKKTRPIFRKVTVMDPSKDSGPIAAGMATTASGGVEGPALAPGRARRGTFGNRSPNVPATRITHTALAFSAPAARAPAAIQTAAGDRKTRLPSDHAASRISAMTTGPKPPTAPCRAGIEWYRK